MLICPAISDTDHVPPRRNNQRRQFSGNIVDEAMRSWKLTKKKSSDISDVRNFAVFDHRTT